MESVYFKSKVNVLIYILVLYAIILFSGSVLMVAAMAYFGLLLTSVIIIVPDVIIFMACTSVKYALKDNSLGVRILYTWKWYPIDEISSVSIVHGILSFSALSRDNIEIRFANRGNFKDPKPLIISPVDRDLFVNMLLRVNDRIEVKK